jgi:putative Ca2+/H+ antiporter (TMEM165/GDT1 family)
MKGVVMTLWPIFLTVFLAEFGDKTQIAMLLFAADQRLSRVGVFLASAGALVLSSCLAVVVGSQVARYVDARLCKAVAGIGFLAIGVWLLLELRRG